MVVAADEAGSLRQLITELEALVAKKTIHADFVLTLARIRDTRETDAELTVKLTTRVAPKDDNGELTALHDAVLVSAAMTRPALAPVCEQIATRLNQFDFTTGDFAAYFFPTPFTCNCDPEEPQPGNKSSDSSLPNTRAVGRRR